MEDQISINIYLNLEEKYKYSKVFVLETNSNK